ncbi:unnamed protein product [Paramecium pentaurelia]|uniref:RING-type domain-containing protein n=1 Tax=Paramecium pentaurelia TaxID=43138 RepID=A0A8S1VWV0_9CILI|nr:unnamed protein product [Paramecium pentaurelia]
MQKQFEGQNNLEDYFLEVEQVISNNVNPYDIKCPICLNVYLDPISCDSCMNHFCRKCYQKKQSTKCPLCNRLSETRKAFPLLRQLLSQLKMKCPHFNQGCQAIIDYDAYDKHIKQCDYSEEICGLMDGKLQCNVVKFKKDIQKHRIYECNYRQCECCHCHQFFSNFKLEMHELKCEEALINCPKCYIKIKIKDQSSHLLICDQNIEKCNYCSVEYSLQQLLIHQNECPLRPVCCVGCSQRFTFSIYYIHQTKCPKFPQTCQNCNQIIIREQFENHKFKDCLIYIKSQHDKEIQNLIQKQQQLEIELKKRDTIIKFSNRFKDPDIFLNLDKTFAFVKSTASKKKDRFVLFNNPISEQRKQWKFKCSQVISSWYAVGVTELSTLYSQKRYQSIGHGSYLVSSNGTMYNNHKDDQNSKESDFQINTNDIIVITIDLDADLLILTNTTQNLSLEIEADFGGVEYYGCACLRTAGDGIQIIQ